MHHERSAAPGPVRDRNIAAEVPTGEKADETNPDQIAASFAGVVTVTVAVGDAIETGQPIATIEAMKMNPKPHGSGGLRFVPSY